MFKNYKIRNYDFKLILLILALTFVGIMSIGSAKESLQSRQILGVMMGFFLMIVISFFDYTVLLKFYWLMYIGNLGLLLWVEFFGDNAKGAQRWLEFGSFRFQPSETAKILLILFFAQFIMKYKDKLNTFKIILRCIVLVIIPLTLILAQPDLSTSIVIMVLFCIIMFAGGISYKVILGALAIAIPTVAIVISLVFQADSGLLQNYQFNRLLAFKYPEQYASEEAYQQLNSVMAIASGQLDGKGYKNNEINSVINGNFVSEPQNDFIFAVIGEEFGFKGSVVVIVLLMGVSLECISVARKAKDVAGTIIAASMGGLIGFQSFLNIGVTTFILPNTGLTLPFVSYGLTSLMSLFMGMGFVLNVRLQAKK